MSRHFSKEDIHVANKHVKNAQHHREGKQTKTTVNKIPFHIHSVDSSAPGTAARQSPLSMGFSRQEHWSRLPFPRPGDIPDPGMEPRPPALQADSFPWATREALTPTRMVWLKGQIWEGLARMCRNWNPHMWLAEIQNSAAVWKTAWWCFKIWRASIWSSISTPKNTPKRNKNRWTARMQMFIAWLFRTARGRNSPNSPSSDKWTSKVW